MKVVEQRPREIDDSHVARLFAAVQQGDMDAFRASYAPGALTWHNDDDVEQTVDEVCTRLGYLCTISTQIAYLDQRIVSIGNLRFVQHVLSASLISGATLTMPAMMRIELAQDGRIARIEEYFDSRAIDCLMEV